MLLVEALERSAKCREAGCLPERMETRSRGFDENLQLIGADGDNTPTATGLRVPIASGFRYRFLAASLVLGPWDRLVGMRVGATIAALIGSGDGGFNAPRYVEERPVDTLDWRFQDSSCLTFTLTKEPHTNRGRQWGPFDQSSFMWRDCDTPALLYQTTGFPLTPPALPGYLGLNAYTPPPMQGRAVRVLKDMPFPWAQNEFLALDHCDPIAMRWRLYCDCLQTNPGTRNTIDIAPSGAAAEYPIGGVVPEELFLQIFTQAAFYKVFGALIYERG